MAYDFGVVLRSFVRDRRAMTSLRISLLFAAVSVFAAIAMNPNIYFKDGETITFSSAIDTGRSAVSTNGSETSTTRYTIRRSVLQENSREPCILYADGRTTGNC